MHPPIGISDFRKLIETRDSDGQPYLFVNKSLFIKEIIDDLTEVKLFTRPRRCWIKTVFIGVFMVISANVIAEIVTLDKDIAGHLTTKCHPVHLDKNGQTETSKTIALLKSTLKPLLPAAGLAAPQIGITQRIFLFSWDRSEEHQIAVINPSFAPLDQETEFGWEGCFSIILGSGPYQLANVPRYKKIKATYFDTSGQLVNWVLEGFAARVFQHEYDHLEGIENIHRKDAEVKTFDSKEKLMAFMNDIKAKDKINYIQPTRTYQ